MFTARALPVSVRWRENPGVPALAMLWLEVCMDAPAANMPVSPMCIMLERPMMSPIRPGAR